MLQLRFENAINAFHRAGLCAQAEAEKQDMVSVQEDWSPAMV